MDLKLSPSYKPLFELLQCWDIVNDSEFTKKYSKEKQEYWLALKGVDTVIMKGGRDCFEQNQLVITEKGAKRIKDVKVGDMVLTYNQQTKEREFNKVLESWFGIKPITVKIRLKNGTTIQCTPEHKFFHNGCWVMVKDII